MTLSSPSIPLEYTHISLLPVLLCGLLRSTPGLSVTSGEGVLMWFGTSSHWGVRADLWNQRTNYTYLPAPSFVVWPVEMDAWAFGDLRGGGSDVVWHTVTLGRSRRPAESKDKLSSPGSLTGGGNFHPDSYSLLPSADRTPITSRVVALHVPRRSCEFSRMSMELSWPLQTVSSCASFAQS